MDELAEVGTEQSGTEVIYHVLPSPEDYKRHSWTPGSPPPRGEGEEAVSRSFAINPT